MLKIEEKCQRQLKVYGSQQLERKEKTQREMDSEDAEFEALMEEYEEEEEEKNDDEQRTTTQHRLKHEKKKYISKSINNSTIVSRSRRWQSYASQYKNMYVALFIHSYN